MSLTRTVLGFLGSLALAAGLCAPVHAQYRFAGNQVTYDESSDISTLRTEVAELRAQANARTGVREAPVAAEGPGGCGGCGGCDAGCGCDTGCGCGCNTGCGCCDTSCGDCWGCSSCCPHLYAAYESVFLKPHFSRDAAFFIERPGAVPAFEEVSFDWDLEYSPRFEVGYLNPCGLGVRARYWRFDHSTTQTGAVTGNASIHASFSSTEDDAAVVIDGVDAITATHSLKLDVLDVEGMKYACGMLFSGGFRWARMDQDYRADAVGGFDETILGHHDIDAFGLTGAMEYYQSVSCSISAFVKIRESLLYGDSTFNATGINSNGDVTGVITRSHDGDLISVSELQVGVEWSMCTQSGGKLYVTAAAEAQYWHNAGTGLPGEVGSDDENYFTSDAQEADMGLFGFNIGAGYIY
jgi:hypothetical protein